MICLHFIGKSLKNTQPQLTSLRAVTLSSLGDDATAAAPAADSWEEPLYDPMELRGILPVDSRQSVDVRLILARILDGSRFHEWKANYGTTLVTGFAKIMGQQVGIIANNGKLI